LEELGSNEGIFGHVAAGLYRLGRSRIFSVIFDGLRPFPFSDGAAEASMQKIDAVDFTNLIAPMLYALEYDERAPKVTPHVIMAFGLAPKTPQGLWMALEPKESGSGIIDVSDNMRALKRSIYITRASCAGVTSLGRAVASGPHPWQLAGGKPEPRSARIRSALSQ
jgi:hypothetical protein